MKNIIDIKRFFKKNSPVYKKNRMTNPDRDWTILLTLAMVCLISLLTSAYFNFINYYNLDQQIMEVSPNTPHYQGSLITEQVEAFKARSEELNALRASYGGASTPVERAATSTENNSQTTITEEAVRTF